MLKTTACGPRSRLSFRRPTTVGIKTSRQNYGVGRHESPSANRTARHPPEADRRHQVLHYGDPGKVPASQPGADRQHRLGMSSPSFQQDRVHKHMRQTKPKNGAETSYQVSGIRVFSLWPGNSPKLESHRKSVGDPKSTVLRSRALLQRRRADGAAKSAWVNIKAIMLHSAHL